MEYHRGTSWKAKLRVAVDKAIWSSVNYNEFLQKMQLTGYEVRQGKHLSFRAPEQKNFTYMKLLGSYHTEENVRTHLKKNVIKPKHQNICPKRLDYILIFPRMSLPVTGRDLSVWQNLIIC